MMMMMMIKMRTKAWFSSHSSAGLTFWSRTARETAEAVNLLFLYILFYWGEKISLH